MQVSNILATQKQPINNVHSLGSSLAFALQEMKRRKRNTEKQFFKNMKRSLKTSYYYFSAKFADKLDNEDGVARKF